MKNFGLFKPKYPKKAVFWGFSAEKYEMMSKTHTNASKCASRLSFFPKKNCATMASTVSAVYYFFWKICLFQFWNFQRIYKGKKNIDFFLKLAHSSEHIFVSFWPKLMLENPEKGGLIFWPRNQDYHNFHAIIDMEMIFEVKKTSMWSF